GRSVTFGDASSDEVNLQNTAVSISTTANGGSLTFNAKVDGAQNLTLATNGAGTIDFKAAVGSGTAIGTGTRAAITITAGVTTFESTLRTNSGLTVTPNITFQDNVTIGAGDTATTFAGNVTLDGLTFASSGNVTFGDASSDQVTLSG